MSHLNLLDASGRTMAKKGFRPRGKPVSEKGKLYRGSEGAKNPTARVETTGGKKPRGAVLYDKKG